MDLFALLFKMNRKFRIVCLSVHVGVTNLLFFHSGAPPLCTPSHLGPAAGWRGGHMGIAGPVNQSSSFVLRGEKPSFLSFFLKKKKNDCILVLYCVRAQLCSLTFVIVSRVCYCVPWAQNGRVLWPFPRTPVHPPCFPTPTPTPTTLLLCLVGAGFSTIQMFLCHFGCTLTMTLGFFIHSFKVWL